jgi:diguanylate cyclase (GGDEF)-like protein/PAS domain S-box-containing protein
MVEGSADLMVAFDDVGTVVFANAASTKLVGWAPEQLVGRSVFDFIHPEDLERAMRALDLNNEFGSAPGTTVFRLAHADGSWVFVDMTGGHATDDGTRVLYSSSSRRADDRFAITETMVRLLQGSTIADALRPVCDVFAWRSNGSQIGISWREPDGSHAAVSTGIDLELVGGAAARGQGRRGDPQAGGAPVAGGARAEAPWAEVRRTGEAFMDVELARVDDAIRDRAHAAGMGSVWVEPIPTPSGEPAVITVWTRVGGRPPLNHAHGMAAIRPIVELILRWFEQQRQLDHAAFHDPLTGVANRKRFFDALASCPSGGAVLYCDLDRFKPVNDQLGHAAGDELLRGVASRLASCVRAGDVVARLGGDEFAVLCPDASAADADALVARIDHALREPFTVAGTEVQVGVSIGVGVTDRPLDEATLEAADDALYRAKADRRPHADARD